MGGEATMRHLRCAPPVSGKGGEAPLPVEGEEEGGDCDGERRGHGLGFINK